MPDRAGAGAPPAKVCLTCGTMLTATQSNPFEKPRYVHVEEEYGQRTHVAIPVDPAELGDARITSICDFCNSIEPQHWLAETEPFSLVMAFLDPETGTVNTYTQNNSALWGACDTCAGYLRRRDWAGLHRHTVRRATEDFSDDHPRNAEVMRALREHLRQIQQGVRENLIDVREVRPEDEY